MIIEKQKEANVLVGGISQESIGMSLDLDSAQMLMQMLSKNLYSDGIGSAIRETASNALDSHRRAGVKEPIVVSFKEAESYNYEFSVEDFGLGLDDEDVKNIISKYGKSTKRQSINELGMFGLGFKAPLAYSSSFYFVCRKNGTERKYMMYEGEDINTIDLLYETPTKERNGVKVIIPVKYKDHYTFKNKIKEQLCYFEDVYFDVPGDSNIVNDFSIIRHKDFQFSEMCNDTKIHICLDNVYYPLDYSKLELKTIYLPIALRFDLTEGLFPIPNRESIRYTQEAKELIKNKIKSVATYFVKQYNKEVEKSFDFGKMLDYINDNGPYIKINNSYENISEIIEYSNIPLSNPKFDNINLLNFKEIYVKNRGSFLLPFSIKYLLKDKKISKINNSTYIYDFNLTNIFKDYCKVYIYSDNISFSLKNYLRDIESGNKKVFFIKKDFKIPLGFNKKFNSNSYYYLLDLKKYPKNQWREVIKEYQFIVNIISQKFIDLDKFVIPQEYLDEKKKEKEIYKKSVVPKKIKLEGEILVKQAENLLRYVDDRNCKFVSNTFKIENISKFKCLTIYGTTEEQHKLDSLYPLIKKQKIQLIILSQREINTISKFNIHNLISFEKFMEGNNSPFKRLVTAHYINKLIENFDDVFSKKQQIGYSCSSLANRLQKLIEYKKNNFANIGYSGGTNNSREFIESMLETAKEKDLFDNNIYSEAIEVEKILTKLDFLMPLCDRIDYYREDSPLVNVMNSLFKYYKHRLDLKHYNLKLNDEIILEETIEELVN